jgi:outer membrane lipoprotein LolB
MSMRGLLLAALAAGVLAACATTVPRAPLPPAEREAAVARQASREEALAQQPDWSLQGRVALSNGQRGGSGRIDWRQDGAAFQVALSAPITRQSWRIEGDAGSARLQGLDGGPRSGPDAARLLREATGWDIPVQALASWVRGARAARGGPARLQFSADGRLAGLQQDGWTLDYGDWRPSAVPGLELPMRISAQRDSARVRLVVDEWSGDGASP